MAQNSSLDRGTRMREMRWIKLAAISCLSFCVAAKSVPAADYPEIGISNSQLHVRLFLPDAKKGYYRGTRFDWSGVIYSFEHRGHDYYGPWYQKRSSGVRDFIYQGSDIIAGPCSAITGPVEEFLTNRTALGYDEAKPGGSFLKIGVGVLRKPDSDAYDRYREYEIIDPGKWTVRSGHDWVEFTQIVNGPDRYAYIYRKTVWLSKDKPEMALEHSLKNTGYRAITTSVYDHNFLVLDRQPPGPGLTITFPFQIEGKRLPQAGLAEIRQNRIVYLKRLENEDRVSTAIEGFSASPSDYDIRIENSRIGAGMRITGNRPLSRVLLWSIRSVIAVEPYIDFTISPGKEFTWEYTYDFYTVSP